MRLMWLFDKLRTLEPELQPLRRPRRDPKSRKRFSPEDEAEKPQHGSKNNTRTVNLKKS